MKMMYKGQKVQLVSRGIERVILHDGGEYRKTVWMVPNEWKFYTRVDGCFIEVYHKACWFSVFPDKEVEA